MNTDTSRNAATGRALAYTAIGLGAVLALRAAARAARSFDFDNKVVLITGGSRGLGLVLARHLLNRGARVAIAARDPDELERARAELAPRGEVQPVLCDITDRARVGAMIRDVEAGTGPIDLLINNAGVIAVGPQEEMTLEDYELAMQVHFWGPVYATLAALPSMKARGAGRIANIASFGGKVAVPHLAPYCASKFALVGFSGSLRAELARDGITVTTVCPGLMRTGSHINALFKGRHREEYTLFKWSQAIPGAAVSADYAADRILRGIAHGEAEVIVGLPAAAAVKAASIAPEWTADSLALIGRALPRPGGIGRGYARGRDSETPATRGRLMEKLDRAAAANNEV